MAATANGANASVQEILERARKRWHEKRPAERPAIMEDLLRPEERQALDNRKLTDEQRAFIKKAADPNAPAASTPRAPEWGAPKRLVAPPTTPEFPLEILPHNLQQFAQKAAEAIHCPVDYVAVPMLATAAGALGGSRRVKIKEGHEQPAILWVQIIGPPGSRKTPALNCAVSPALDRDRDLAEQERCHVVGDITPEALAYQLQNNPQGLLMHADELSGLQDRMGQYKKKGGDEKQFYCSLNSGAAVRVHRRTDNLRIAVDRPALSIAGGIQPKKIRTQMRDEEDGYAHRFLTAWPEPLPHRGDDEKTLEDRDRKVWADAMKSLYERKPAAGGVPVIVPFSNGAWGLWKRYTAGAAKRMNAGIIPEWLWGYEQKLEAFTARLALVLACLHTDAATLHGKDEQVQEADLARAIKAACYFRRTGLKVLHHIEADPRIEPAGRALRWILSRDNPLSDFQLVELNQALRGSYRAEQVEAAAELLLKRCYIRKKEAPPRQGAGRPPTPTFEVNPAASELAGRNAENAENGAAGG